MAGLRYGIGLWLLPRLAALAFCSLFFSIARVLLVPSRDRRLASILLFSLREAAAADERNCDDNIKAQFRRINYPKEKIIIMMITI